MLSNYVKGARDRQSLLLSRNAPGRIPASQCPTPATAFPADLQSPTRLYLPRLETDPAPLNA